MGAKKGRPKPVGSGRKKTAGDKEASSELQRKRAAIAQKIELENKEKELELSEREMAIAVKRRQYERYLKTDPRFDKELANVQGREFFSTANELASSVLRKVDDEQLSNNDLSPLIPTPKDV